MWFATNKGICKYDGSKFISYTSDQQSSVAGSTISEDRYGRIWYCNFDGYLYYVENGKLRTFNQPETIGYFKYGIIQDDLYLIQKNKLLIYDLKTLKGAASHKIEGEKVYFTFSDDSHFYVLSDYLYVFSGKKLYSKYNVPEDLKKNYRSAIIQKSEQGLIIVSKERKFYYLFTNGKFTEKKFPSEISFIQNVSFVDGKNWISSTKGIYRLDTSKKNEPIVHYFPDHNISSIYKDRQGNYWVSTINQGLLLIEDFHSKFFSIPSKPVLLEVSGNQLMISSEKDELILYSLKDNHFQKVYAGNSNHSIYQMLADDDLKNIFFTSSSFKILKNFNKVQTDASTAVKEIRKIDHKYYSFAASGICGIFRMDNSGPSIWDGIYRSLETPDVQFSEIGFLKYCNGKSTAYNPYNQNIYYATNVGLFSRTLKGQKELFFENKRLYISKLAGYKDHVFALSTNGKIYTLSRDNTIRNFQVPDEIKEESVYKIKVIGNSLFLFGENTLFEYDLINKSFRKTLANTNNLDVSDVALHNGQVIFATSKGLLITERKTTERTVIPKFIINRILVNNKVPDKNELKNLDNSQNTIEILFSVLSYVPSQKPEVFYRINDHKWKLFEEENRSLILNSLSPGNYKIDFRTKTGSHFSDIYPVKFTISKPFWLKAGFIIPVILLFFIFFYLLFRFRINKIRKQNQLLLDRVSLEKNLNQSKLKAIKSQMNPHFFYNALNTIQAYVLSNEKKLAINYLSKFSLLTRTILEMSEKEWVTLSEEIRTTELYLEIEKARFNNDFEYEIFVDENIDTDNQKIPSMLLQPFVENAVKHGLLHKKNEKKLLIHFQREERNIEIRIDDNGIGRKKSRELNLIKTKKHKSFATDAVQQRIDLLNLNNKNMIRLSYTDKINDAGNATGTTVIIKIPLE